MRPPRIVLMLLCILPMAHAATEDLYKKADALYNSGSYTESLAAFEETAVSAKKESLPNYEFSALYYASYSALRLSKNLDSLRYAEDALRIAVENRDALWAQRRKNLINEIELIGLVERADARLARIGEGWKQNRRAIARLREISALPPVATPPSPVEVAALPLDARNLGWRLIEREAFYLHETGLTTQARLLLRAAIEASGDDLKAGVSERSFYPLKLVGSLAIIEGFIGYDQTSLELLGKERELSAWKGRRNMMRLDMNYFLEFTDLYGADADIIRHADKILAEAIAGNSPDLASIKRTHVRIAAKKLSYAERVAQLASAIESNRTMENEQENFFATRDLLFEHARQNKPDLDDQFHALLNQIRLQGNLRAEPRLYRHYGDWLRCQGRYAESIRTLRQALQLTLRYEWHPLVPSLYAKLGASYLADGQVDQAEAMWREIDRYVAAHTDIPAHMIVNARKSQLDALLQAGRLKEATAFAQKWRHYGVTNKVSDYWLAAFDPALIQLRSTENSAVVDVTKKNVLLNPSAITTIALTGQPASTSVYLLNPDSKSVRGTLSLTGPGLAVQAGDKEHLEILCTAGKPDADATTPLSLDGGDFIKIQLSVLPAQSSDAKKPGPITLTWKDTAGGVARTAVWNYNWDEASSNAAVLDAAQTGLNPFIGLPVEHSVYIPETSKSTIPFRIRANHPLRIEYVDAHSGVLLAVDHNGNGDFAESGDFCAPAADTSVNSATPVVGVGSETSTAKIEVWYFPNEETKQTHDIELDIELLLNTRWEQQAVDRIKFDQ